MGGKEGGAIEKDICSLKRICEEGINCVQWQYKTKGLRCFDEILSRQMIFLGLELLLYSMASLRSNSFL